MQKSACDPDFLNMLAGFGLTTAEILYRMPDHPHLLQSFSWQFADMAPAYPRLKRFLSHWEREGWCARSVTCTEVAAPAVRACEPQAGGESCRSGTVGVPGSSPVSD